MDSKHSPITHPDGVTCERCIVPSPTNRSARIAWAVASIAVGLLILVFFLGVGSARSTILTGSGFALAGLLLCPLMMGVMMWMMMRKGH